MPGYGLSALEIKHLIERALLPDRCEFIEKNGLLALRLTQREPPFTSVTLTAARLESLYTSRAIAELIGEARSLLASANLEKSKPMPVKLLHRRSL